jgi:tRNA A37 threonylcarbamoyladenosine modification protein TsaB
VTGAKLVAVPTLDIVIENAPVEHEHVAVCLGAKRGQCFTGVYHRDADHWQRVIDPTLMTPAELIQRAKRPLAVVGDHLPPFDWPGDVECLDGALAEPRSEVAWRLGRAAAKAGRFVEALALTPLYIRLPEAEEVWQAKQAD